MTIDSNEREMRQSNLDQPKKQPDKRNQRPIEEENNLFSRIFCKRMELKFGAYSFLPQVFTCLALGKDTLFGY